MAKFNPTPPDAQEPVYNRLSEGPGVNRSFATLFSGAGDIVDNVTKAGYEGVVRHIKQDAKDMIEPIRGAAGVDAAVEAVTPVQDTTTAPTDVSSQEQTVPTQPGGPPKVALKRLGARLKSVQNAYQQGELSDSRYYAQLESSVRQLKSRYVGFDEEVTEVVQGITGVVPANALRRAIQQDAEKAANAASSSADKQFTYIKQNEKYLPPNWKNLPFTTIQDHVISQKQAEFNIDRAKSRLGLEGAVRSEVEARTEAAATVAADNYVQKTLNEYDTQLGGTFQEFAKKMMEKGTKSTPEEITALRTQFARKRMEVEQGLENVLSASLEEGGSESFRSILKEKTERVKKQSLGRLDAVHKALTDNDVGTLHLLSLDTKAKKDALTNQFMGNRAFAVAAAMKEAGQMDLYANLVFKNPKVLKEMTQLITGVETAETITGNPTTLHQKQEAARTLTAGNKAVSAEVERTRVEQHVKLLTDPQTPPEVALRAARVMFNSDTMKFIRNFEPQEQIKVWAALTSDAVSKKMVELRNTPGGFEAWADYKDYSLKAAQQLFSGVVADVNDTVKDPRFSVSYNRDTNRFRTELKPPFNTRTREIGMNSQLEFRVMRLNQIMSSLEPIFKADGMDPLEYTQQLGLDLTKGTSFQQQLLPEGVRRGLDEMRRGGESAASSIGKSIMKMLEGEPDPLAGREKARPNP